MSGSLEKQTLDKSKNRKKSPNTILFFLKFHWTNTRGKKKERKKEEARLLVSDMLRTAKEQFVQSLEQSVL